MFLGGSLGKYFVSPPFQHSSVDVAWGTYYCGVLMLIFSFPHAFYLLLLEMSLKADWLFPLIYFSVNHLSMSIWTHGYLFYFGVIIQCNCYLFCCKCHLLCCSNCSGLDQWKLFSGWFLWGFFLTFLIPPLFFFWTFAFFLMLYDTPGSSCSSPRSSGFSYGRMVFRNQSLCTNVVLVVIGGSLLLDPLSEQS